ncbi:MAG TPA: acyl-CoA dehydrogenase family protein [Dehalococcoidia bacterium]|nr:acyl-CoA dehydrogenase family protein [Dehalococcoidia bacterium]
MVDLALSEEVERIRDMTRDFARHEMRRAGIEIDEIADPTAAYTSETLRRVLAHAYELGFHKLNLPKDVGGLGAPEMAGIVVQEEMAVGDAGLASHFLVAPMIAGIAAAAPDKHPFYRDYLDAFVADTKGVHSGAWAVTEPNHGSDLFQFGQPEIHMEASAVLVGDRYVVNGQKSAFVSNGWLADALLLMVNNDASRGMEGTITFAIPGNLPGITRGKPLNKVGLRGLNQAEIFFDNVEIAPEFVLLPPGPAYRMTIERIVTGGNTAVGTLAVGVARAAYEEARAYARQRVQGGRPICQYDSIKLKLFNAYRQIEAARALLWKSAWLIATGRPHLPTAMAARTLASDMAMSVTADMVQVFGGYGISKDHPVEKFYRDAKPLQIMDGTNEMVSLKAADALLAD